MKHLSIITYILAFALFFAAGFFLLHSHSLHLLTDNKNSFDHYATDLEVTDYDEAGHVKSILKAELATHYTNSGETIFKNPHLHTIGTENNLPWHIRSDKAVLNKAQDQAVLTGHVIVHQLSVPGHPDLLIKTSKLIAFLKTSKASTDKPVTIIRPGTILHGVGLKADLKTGEYQLLSQSHATIDLQKQPKHKK
ncbi:MAG: LPS export ABC transporter periplasmic protein LptC [Coxiellaceae bacterium]|nr:LPS export ABC transporter periplasmic protein LptC [Coxiellaceae bacterium]